MSDVGRLARKKLQTRLERDSREGQRVGEVRGERRERGRRNLAVKRKDAMDWDEEFLRGAEDWREEGERKESGEMKGRWMEWGGEGVRTHPCTRQCLSPSFTQVSHPRLRTSRAL